MIPLYRYLPTLDLHGIDRDYAKILINDFVRDHYNMKSHTIAIVHGIGSGIIRKTTQETLRKNKLVKEFKIDNFNSGMTIVTIINKDWQN